MATGGGSANPVFGDVKRQSLICSLCLEVFRSPKLLPCHHSFCLRCLEDLAESHNSGSFPCPQCRRVVIVPPGGVANFQSNFYLRQEDLDRAEDEALCSIHPTKDLDLYCVDCQQPVCVSCFVDEHKKHDMKKIQEVASQVSEQLTEDEERLQKIVSCMIHRVNAERAERQSARDKKTAVEMVIRGKHAWLTSLVDKCRDECLASLASVSGDVDSRLTKDLDCKQANLGLGLRLQQRLQRAVSSGACVPLLDVAKEMKEWSCSPQVVSEMITSAEGSSVRRPVLRSKLTSDVLVTQVRDFFGAAEEEETNLTAFEVEVVEKFRFGQERDDIEVFSLCPVDTGSRVLLSFARRGLKTDAPSEELDERGNCLHTHDTVTGKRSWKSRGGGKVMASSTAAGRFITFDKSLKKTILQLNNAVSAGIAYVQEVTVTSEEPYKTTTKPLFTINTAPHRAFTVDSSDQLCVVLAEARGAASGTRRIVHLYHRDQRDALATYEPPSVTCRPSDVCFWRWPCGRGVLVVADEGTDSLHAVRVQDGKFSFEGYLAPGNSLIVQPTALNTDTQGRLWVALRGGQIITLSAVA